MKYWNQASLQTTNLVHVSGAVDFFGAYGVTKPAGHREGPSRDGEHGAVAEEGGELIRLQRGRHHHNAQPDWAVLGAFISLKEDFL